MAANSYFNSHPSSLPLDDKEDHQHLLSSELWYPVPPSLHEHPAHRPTPLYDSGDLVDHHHQQQNLLSSPGLASGHTSGQNSPLKPFIQSSAGHSRTNSGQLKPFHLKANMDHTHHAHVQQNTAYHGATQSSANFEQMKAIKQEDIVRIISHKPRPRPLANQASETQSTNPALTDHNPCPRPFDFHRSLRPDISDSTQIPHNP